MFENQPVAFAPGDGFGVAVRNVRRQLRFGSAPVLRTLLLGGAAAAVAIAAMTGDPAAHLRADPDLSHLLRGMAVIKAGLAVTALAVLSWRFARPIPPATAVAYLVGAWLMTAASMVVWRLSAIGIGALAFHSGELTLLVVAWREHRRESTAPATATTTAPVTATATLPAPSR